jgi:hypothetical protein
MKNQGVKRMMVRNLRAKRGTKVILREGKKIQRILIVMKEPLVKSSEKLEMELSMRRKEGKDLKGKVETKGKSPRALLTSRKKAEMWPLAEIV